MSKNGTSSTRELRRFGGRLPRGTDFAEKRRSIVPLHFGNVLHRITLLARVEMCAFHSMDVSEEGGLGRACRQVCVAFFDRR